jgi:metal-responsive CopG/Arc/MetJ family transcriptional regulator
MIEIRSKKRKQRTRAVSTSKASATTSRKIIVEFPAALYEETQRAVTELATKRSILIRDAVSEYLRRLERQNLARELAEGYRANAELNRTISEDFIHVDAENF